MAEPLRVEGHLVSLGYLTPDLADRGTLGLRRLVAQGDGIVTVRTPDRETALIAYEAIKDAGRVEWLSDTDFRTHPPDGWQAEAAAKGHRRCESCGMAMRPRLYRARDDDDRLVCDGCKATGLGPKEWNVAYASLPPVYQREAEVRHDATVAGLALLAEVRKCPSCQGQGSYEDDDGRERSCPRCNGDGVLDVPAKTSAYQRSVDRDGDPVRVLIEQQDDGQWFWSIDRAGGETVQNGFASNEVAAKTQASAYLGERLSSLRVEAHDSGDGETIFHCPFCGSGAVVGGADGTVTCDFCHTAFTVQVQPTHTNMPQTVEGQPYNIPGMPGGGPDAGAATQDARQDAGQAQDGAPAPGSSPSADANKGKSPAADKAAQDGAGAPEAKKPNPFAKGSHLVVNGGVLPLDTALQALALAHADDRDAVLTQVRAENTR